MTTSQPASTALVAVDLSKRSVSRFPIVGDPWPAIEAWAARNSYVVRGPQAPQARQFQRGIGILVAPMLAKLTRVGDVMEVHAWLQIPLFTRIMSLFLMPAEMNVASGGFRAVIPRSMARRAVNELLAEMNGAPIA